MIKNRACRIAAVGLVSTLALTGGASAQTLSAVGGGNTLVSVNSDSGASIGSIAITGLGSGQQIVAIDARPATSGRILYAISNTGQLYAINPRTGVASAVGAPIALNGTAFGFDFNPTVDRIRVVSDTGQNLRVNPDTGAVIVDAPLNITIGGQPITVTGNTGAAYSNNVDGATTTTLFVINSETGALQIQAPPNDGTLTTVGGVGGNAAGIIAGFDISNTGEARLTVVQEGVTRLFSVNLQTGEATLIGVFGPSGVYQGLAFTVAAFASDANLTPNQRAIGNAFDNFTSVDEGFIPLLNALDALPDNAARADAFTQLSAVSYGILPEVVLQTSEFADGTMRRHLRNSRTGRVASDGTVYNDHTVGGFLVATTRNGEFEARGDRGDIDYQSIGFMGGIDFRPTPGSVVGIAAGYDNSDIQLNTISPESSAKTWFVGAYGTLGLGMLNIDLTGTYGKTDFDLNRNVAFVGFAQDSTSQADATFYGLTGTVGAKFDMSVFEVEPYVGLRYVDVSIDGFSEGEALTNLSVDEQNLKSLQGIAGLRLAGDMAMGNTVIRPSIFGEYRREFRNNEDRTFLTAFNGDGISTPFTTISSPMGDDHLVAGAELAVGVNNAVELLVDYQGQFFGGYDIHAFQGGVRVRF